MFGVNVPREMKPARSRANARELLEACEDALLGELLDSTLTAFLSALAAQAGAGSVQSLQPVVGSRRRAERNPSRRRR